MFTEKTRGIFIALAACYVLLCIGMVTGAAKIVALLSPLTVLLIVVLHLQLDKELRQEREAAAGTEAEEVTPEEAVEKAAVLPQKNEDAGSESVAPEETKEEVTVLPQEEATPEETKEEAAVLPMEDAAPKETKEEAAVLPQEDVSAAAEDVTPQEMTETEEDRLLESAEAEEASREDVNGNAEEVLPRESAEIEEASPQEEAPPQEDESHRRIRECLEHSDPEKDFVMHYQPQVDGLSGALVGVEVFPHLVGDLEDCSPAELIPVAEEMGLMNRIGTHIAESAFSRIHEWGKRYGKNLTITINLSPLQLADADYIAKLRQLVGVYAIEPSQVVLDVENGVLLDDGGTVKETLRSLHAFGFVLSLNDFGGGDINLSYVLDCGFEGIKLSRSLVTRANDEMVMRLIRSIISVADAMNLEVTAVGIESKETAKKLMELGITRLQGYYYGRPVRPEELEERFPRIRFYR